MYSFIMPILISELKLNSTIISNNVKIGRYKTGCNFV